MHNSPLVLFKFETCLVVWCILHNAHELVFCSCTTFYSVHVSVQIMAQCSKSQRWPDAEALRSYNKELVDVHLKKLLP